LVDWHSMLTQRASQVDFALAEPKALPHTHEPRRI
jgi:hypothetical protein